MAAPARSTFSALSRPVLNSVKGNVNAVASSSRYLSSSIPRTATSPSQPPTSSSSSSSSSSDNSSSALPVSLKNITHLSFPRLKPLKPTHGVHVATLHLQSYHPYNLDLTTQFAVHSAHSLKIPTTLPAFLPKEKSLHTVLKSPFVKKKAQENFQRLTHKRAIKVYDATPEALDLWLRYLRQNGLPGVGMKAYTHEWVDLGFGKNLQAATESPEEVEAGGQEGGSESQSKIAEAAEELVKALSEGEDAASTGTKGAKAVEEDAKEEKSG
ncbi:30S small subunit ribosomal protein S10 [Kwoniella heveanensis CBS 569]|uniref:Small ribosomal subunit protein uS10m n=1 Tax=Kwoniella heveanensis BCC8398 TaxID=1296120 RepID=A0A1B9GT00_9TREE|nr:30S small subunit ribosomal protein S10 [Kwoniella heveanensis BCC8398]OCF44393.1 30S small subunit ribosomal protein S10 [Kwoniella heveanensis CBS 569]